MDNCISQAFDSLEFRTVSGTIKDIKEEKHKKYFVNSKYLRYTFAK